VCSGGGRERADPASCGETHGRRSGRSRRRCARSMMVLTPALRAICQPARKWTNLGSPDRMLCPEPGDPAVPGREAAEVPGVREALPADVPASYPCSGWELPCLVSFRGRALRSRRHTVQGRARRPAPLAAIPGRPGGWREEFRVPGADGHLGMPGAGWRAISGRVLRHVARLAEIAEQGAGYGRDALVPVDPRVSQPRFPGIVGELFLRGRGIRGAAARTAGGGGRTWRKGQVEVRTRTGLPGAGAGSGPSSSSVL